MKVIFTIAICIVFISVALAQRPKSDYVGEIYLRDGETVKYTAISSKGYGTQILYSRAPWGEKITGLRRYIEFENISRIDFLESRAKMKEKEYAVGVEVKITFHDDTVWDSLYIHPSSFMFWTPYDKGTVTGEDAIAITFIPKYAKRCHKCSKWFPQVGYLYCPFDGTKLK